jgi:hypothetical protein
MTKKYYLFLDESGDHGLKNLKGGSNDLFLLCGVLIEATKYQEFRERFNRIKMNFWDNTDIVFHSSDIRKWRKGFEKLYDQQIRAEFYSQINETIRTSEFTVITAAIRKKEYVERWGVDANDVYEQSTSFIAERTVFFLDDIKDCKKQVYVVAEMRGGKEDKLLRLHCQNIFNFGTGHVHPNRFQNYRFTIHFRQKKQNVNGLQLADLIAYPLRCHISEPDKQNIAMSMINRKLYQKNGNIYGLKVYPK